MEYFDVTIKFYKMIRSNECFLNILCRVKLYIFEFWVMHYFCLKILLSGDRPTDQAQKIKKESAPTKWNFRTLILKNFLCFRKRKLRKKFLHFLERSFSYISENTRPKKFFVFQETELSYISGNGHPKKLFIFQEVSFWAPKVKGTQSKKTSYIEEKCKNVLVL